ncbi:MAG TPA: hypothetical protein VF734_15760 [Pseudonocardiaceae bacterium]
MKTSDFRTKHPDFSAAQPVATLPPEHFEPGQAATRFTPGDFILVKGHGVQGWLITFGQKLRIHGTDRKYVDWAHAALIVDHDGTLIEAVGTGVREKPLDYYTGRHYQIFRIEASDENRAEAVAFARSVLDNKAKYGPLTIISIALSMLTGSKLMFFIDGQYVCSGLVASALERTGSIFTRCAANITAADLAKYFDPAQRPYLAVSETPSRASLPASGPEVLAKISRTS